MCFFVRAAQFYESRKRDINSIHFPINCLFEMFRPCYSMCGGTNGRSRLPVPAIVEVSNPTENREPVREEII